MNACMQAMNAIGILQFLISRGFLLLVRILLFEFHFLFHALLMQKALSVGYAFPDTTRPNSIVQCPGSISRSRNSSTEASPENDFKERVEKIKETQREPYPRLASDSRRISCAEFRSRYSHLTNNETGDDIVVLHGRFLFFEILTGTRVCFCILRIVGRIRSSRASGNKLRFFDFFQDGHKVQILCNLHRMDGVSSDEFKKSHHIFRRGDAFCMYIYSLHTLFPFFCFVNFPPDL